MSSPDRRTNAAALLVACGAFTLVTQTLLLRELMVSFHGGELGTGLLIACWLVWIGVGAALARRIEASQTPRILSRVLLAFLPAALVQGWGLSALRALAGLSPAEPFPLAALVPLLVLLTAPTSLLTGLLFPLLAHARNGTSPARLYAWETLGSFLGGGGFTLGLLVGLSPWTLLGLAAAGLGIAGVLQRSFSLRAVGIGLLVAGSALALGGRALGGLLVERQVTALLPHARTVAHRETPHGRLSWVERPRQDQEVLIQDGRAVASWPADSTGMAEAALPVAEHGDPKRILLLGDPAGTRAEGLLAFPGVERVESWSPEASIPRFLEHHAPHVLPRDDRYRFRARDPRAGLARASPRRFDLVILAGSAPWTAAGSRLYTREFYEDVARILRPGGVFCTSIPSDTNYLGPELSSLGGGVLATLEAVFPQVQVLPGNPARLFASDATGALTADPEVLARRYRNLDAQPALPPQIFASLFEPDRISFVREAFSRAVAGPGNGGAAISTDARPVGLAQGLLFQARLSEERPVRMLEILWAGGGAWVRIPLVVLALLTLRALLLAGRVREGPPSKRSSSERANHAPGRARVRIGAWMITSGGFVSLAAGLALLYAFQFHTGALYGRIGLLNALLLVGLAAGSAAGARWLAPGGSRPGVAIQFGVLVPCAAGALLLPPALEAVPAGGAGELAFYAFAFLAGFLPGTVLAVGAGLGPEGGEGARLLFVADHVGGAVGAALGGVFLLPVLGLPATAALLATVLLTTALLGLARPLFARSRVVRALSPLARRLRPAPVAAPRLLGLAGAVALVATLCSIRVHHRLETTHTTLSEAELAHVVGDRSAVPGEHPFPHHRLVDATGDTDAVVVRSSAVTREIHGYAGAIELLVEVDAEGRFGHLEVLSSSETPAYFAPVRDRLGTLEGRSVTEPLALRSEGGDVDAISGATLSWRATLETLEATGRAVGRQILEIPGVPSPAADRGSRAIPPAAVYLLVALPLAVPILYRGNRRLRLAFLAANAFVGGIWLNTQLSLASVVGLLQGTFPAPTALPLFVLIVGIGLLTVLFGPVYCGLLCPVGALQELAGRMGARWTVSPAADRVARSAKYLVLALLVTGLAMSGRRGLLDADPLASAFAGPYGGFGGLLLVGIGVSALCFHRAWCRYLCPTGALLSLGNRVALLRRRMPPRPYPTCDLGIQGIDDLDCIQCNRCLERHRAEKAPPLRLGPAPRERSEGLERSGWLLAGIVGLLFLLLVGEVGTRFPEASPAPASGLRQVDEEQYRRLMEQNRLSDRVADYWKPAESGP